MMVHILREANAQGVRVEDDVDDSLLVKHEGEMENDDEHVWFVEYRFPNSDVIVHRSVHLTKKRLPDAIGAIAQSFVG